MKISAVMMIRIHEMPQNPDDHQGLVNYGEWVYIAHRLDDPLTVKEALSSPEKREWMKAMESEIGMIAIKEYVIFPTAPALVEPHHQIVWSHIQDTRWGSLNPLQKCSQCILQLQPTGSELSIEKVSHHCQREFLEQKIDSGTCSTRNQSQNLSP